MQVVRPWRWLAARGMTLVEVVLALGVLAVALPLLAMALGGGLEARAQAGLDTRAGMLVRRVQVELAGNRGDAGLALFPDGLPQAGAPGAEVPVWVAVDPAGGRVGQLDERAAAAGLRGTAAVDLVRVGGMASAGGTVCWTVRVETPAAAAAPQRRRVESVWLARAAEVGHGN